MKHYLGVILFFLILPMFAYSSEIDHKIGPLLYEEIARLTSDKEKPPPKTTNQEIARALSKVIPARVDPGPGTRASDRV